MKDKDPTIQLKLHKPMNEMAKFLDEYFGEENGFCLLVFPTNKPAEETRANYISNCKREDMINAMKEFIARNQKEANNE